MKLLFLGDSITQGARATSEDKNYVSQVGQILGVQTINCGLSGTRIARRKNFSVHTHDLDFNLRFERIFFDADYLFVFGGTNDYGHGDAEIGNDNDTDEFTFCGAVNSLIDKALKKFDKDKIIFLLPLKRFNQNTKPQYAGYNKGTLIDFVNALRRILDRRGIRYIDLYNMFDEPKTNTNEGYFADGLHPNDLGHRKIAEIIADFVKEEIK